MPHLVSVDATIDLYVSRSLGVTFSTTRPLAIAADTAVLLVTETGGSEFGIRLERGRVTDVYLWDVGRLLRQRLPTQDVSIIDTTVRCVIPTAVLPQTSGVGRVTASLIVNGALIQSGLPVTLSSGSVTRPTLSAPVPTGEPKLTKQLVKEGRNDG